ncbi:Dolichol kinase [Halopenitus malekzadehii]|uniref:Dolichol kinase n=1 Tax=Halopenitus malekzadehii TaxID=1267564 RepID=A0A1H6IKC1_9EURY|nr:dolichol kinase [Halopenitus malekzadehii]SEH49927.1 Dolichol kinase [Halopenitus malekzadehii]
MPAPRPESESAHDSGSAGWRDRIELERRLVHAGGAFYVAPYLLGWIDWPETRILLLAGLCVVAVLEFLRLGIGCDHAIFRTLTRSYERDNVAGYALYQLSMTGVVVWFSPSIAIPTLWMLAFGDPVSGALGRNAADEYKRPAVWIITFFVCVAVAVPITVPAFGPTIGTLAAVVGAIGATIADGLPPLIRGQPVDDNLTIPLFAVTGIWSVVAVLG